MLELAQLLALALPLGWTPEPLSTPAAPLQGAAPQVVFQVQYDPDKQPGHPDYVETLANVVYPPGKGPISQGYPVEPLPVLIMVRGGNSNFFGLNDLTLDAQAAAAPGGGFIGVSLNMPIVENGQDYRAAADGVALSIQYLRWQATDLNVDPDRIFLVGRSFGCVLVYSVAYKEDFQDLGSASPHLAFESRPDYVVPRFGPSQLTCFGADISSWSATLSLFFFPNKAFEDSTFVERMDESATWWLLNPELYGRTKTPTTCVVFSQSYDDECSTNQDVHSGMFGDLMLAAIREFSIQSGDARLWEDAGAIDLDQYPEPAGAVTAWAIERMAEDGTGLWMLPPSGTVDPVLGGTISLTCFGAEPGATVAFYRGDGVSSYPLPGCPGQEGKLLNFVLLGEGIAGPGGGATITYQATGAQLGTTDFLHAVDFTNCELSQVQTHRYY